MTAQNTRLSRFTLLAAASLAALGAGCARPATGLFVVVHTNVSTPGPVNVSLMGGPMGDNLVSLERFQATRLISGEGGDVIGTLGLDAPDPFVEGSFTVTVSLLDPQHMNMPLVQQSRRVTLQRDTVLRLDLYLLDECRTPPAACTAPNQNTTCGINPTGIVTCIPIVADNLSVYVPGHPPPDVTLPGADAMGPPH